GEYCDRIVLVHDGRIRRDGGASDVITAAEIRNSYGAEVSVDVSTDGRPRVTPGSQRTIERPTAPPNPSRFELS
ncbi:MAG: cobalamin/Fe(3+)-siderophore ABC transporter ATP-binding protein, partial [Candidatus Latescibacterota bacterium]|nr:cobalamin/Fe(3+)-siderophore ABC transporter ATP-binding protein [Candidatus Latescibacterota bacterium]